jgi:ABC-type uncharacterized transport system auxiliary subunit
MSTVRSIACLSAAIALLCCSGCSTLFGKMPVKQYYVLNFVPSAMTDGRLSPSPYPFTLRLKELDIEEAYARPQIVYRQSPFELLYYNYKMWAVKPNRMVTDLILKQLAAANLVSHVVQRYDEEFNPDYELTGTIEAMEEYDSDQIWFAHLAIRFSLARLSDGVVLYSRQFDNRKRVFRYSPEAVVQELSATLEFIMVQALHDMDAIFAKESGGVGTAVPPTEVPK